MRLLLLLAFALAGAAHGAHPLNTEDTDTQGKGGWQVELNGERNKDEGVRGYQAAALLSHGLLDTLDLQVGLPWQDNGFEKGVGDAIVALKWRFWTSEPWSAGLRAGVTLPTGNEDKGLGNGKTTWAALVMGQYEGERWIFLGHAGYRRNENKLDNRVSINEISGAVLYKATEELKLLVDASRTTNPDRSSDTALRQTVAGLIYLVKKNMDVDIGWRRGNQPAIDRAVMLGTTIWW